MLQVKELFLYIEDGRLIHRDTALPAGEVTARGPKVRIKDTRYHVRQLVWLYHNPDQPLPATSIFPVDLDYMNTRIENLSLTPPQSTAPPKPPEKTTLLKKTPCKGVRWDKNHNLYEARIGFDDLSKHIGYSDCRAEAAAHRLACEQAYNWEGSHFPTDKPTEALLYMQTYLNLKLNKQPQPRSLRPKPISPEAFEAAYQKLHAPVPTSILEQLKLK